MSKGRFGVHGGQYMPETLMNAVTSWRKPTTTIRTIRHSTQS